MPLQRRLPKRGFTNVFKKVYDIINIRDLNRFSPNTEVGIEALRAAGLVKKKTQGIKLLGKGELSHPVSVRVHKVSRTAREKVEAAGGKVDLI
jgi:large subunit ribosomal protein L15